MKDLPQVGTTGVSAHFLPCCYYFPNNIPIGNVSEDLGKGVCLFIVLFLKIFLCVWLFLPACVSVYRACASCPWKSEKALRCRGTVILNVCEPTCGCWELNIGPLFSWATSPAPGCCCFVLIWIPLPLLCVCCPKHFQHNTWQRETSLRISTVVKCLESTN